MKSYSKKILNSLNHDIFKIISDTSDDLKIETYIVGGFVRDLIIDKSVKKDIDIMCIGSGIDLGAIESEMAMPYPVINTVQEAISGDISNLLIPQED